MSLERLLLPPGYTWVTLGDAEIVALPALVPSLQQALQEGTIYDWAAHHPASRTLFGRGVAYAVPLPDGGPTAVVRRSRHGGLLAPLTGDRFLAGTRAPRELEVSLRLARLGVPTPEVLAYATYAAGPLLRRADVLTREVPGGADLADLLGDAPSDELKRHLLDTIARLLVKLALVGARHPDLNLKNILIAPDENGETTAFALDVDRVWFDDSGPAHVMSANLRRLSRSARKLRRLRGLPVDEEDLLWLATAVSEALEAPNS
ncbi:MAG TPA: lipopolysaccharide kinase InaA family protein [Gemmatimonadaceae bacterium]|nr:lipopolysaccharide kinase InaA family protein [Gemmatimonadaceae bacterium]